MRLRWNLLAVLVAFVLVAAACGDDDSADDASASGSEAAEETSASASEPEEASEPAEEEPEEVEEEAPAEEPEEEAADDAMEEDATEDAAEEPVEEGPTTVVDMAVADGQTFIPQFVPFGPEFAEAAEGPGPVTAFLVSDAALGEAQTSDVGVALQADFELLAQVLAYHISTDGAFTAEELAAAGTINTVQGEPITVELVDGVVVLNGGQATVTKPDLVADNGIGFIIDGLLLPPSIAAQFEG